MFHQYISPCHFCPQEGLEGPQHCIIREGVHAQYQQDSDVASQAANNTRILPISENQDDVRGVTLLVPPLHHRATEQVLNAES